MKFISKNLCLTALCLAFNQASNAQKPNDHHPDNIADAINASNQLYSKGFETHNAALIVNRYTADGAIIPPNSTSIRTQRGFLAFFNSGYDHGIRKVLLHTTGLFGRSNNMINEEGLYELKDEKEHIIDKVNTWLFGKRPVMAGKCTGIFLIQISPNCTITELIRLCPLQTGFALFAALVAAIPDVQHRNKIKHK